MKKTVTVSIPVYNGEKFIREAIQSVIDQTIKVDKIIICDNCSNDNTSGVLNKFIAEHTEYDIELVVNDENIGFQNNFIKCYELATTDFLVILHVDDLLKPYAIEKQLDFFNKHPHFSVVGGQGDNIDSKGTLKVKKDKKNDLLFEKNEIYEFIKATSSYIPFSTVMYNLKLTKDIGFFEEDSVGPDELYWPLLLKKHPIAVLSDSLINNRIHEGQMHVSNSIEMFDKYMKHFRDKLDRANLESTRERKLKTKNIIKKQVARMSIKIGQEIFTYNKNFYMTSKYFMYGIRQFPKVIFSKFFIKSIAKMMHLTK